MSGETNNCPEIPRRRALKVAASCLCAEAGFMLADEAVLETLVEMMQSFITELGANARSYAELACRTEPMVSDISMALIDMGVNIDGIQRYAKSSKKMAFMPPGCQLPSAIPRTLQAGDRKSHPSHIPEYLPPFPDPHTYIRTPTVVEPMTEYQLLRERAASQKRDVERALTRFIAKTGHTENLFPDDPYAYPLIACKPKQLPYLEALLPKHLDLESLDDPEDVKNPNESVPGLPTTSVDKDGNLDTSGGSQASYTPIPVNPDVVDVDSENTIDNPYLRPIKMPKFKTKKGKY